MVARVLGEGEEFRGQGNAWFQRAVFERSVSLGPLVCAGRVNLSWAVFGGPATVSIAAEAVPFVLPDRRPVAEQVLADAPDAMVRMVSPRGVDAAYLVLADVDLADSGSGLERGGAGRRRGRAGAAGAGVPGAAQVVRGRVKR
ncbi:hypothetical protein [Streptomyces scopuliridis]|uniref:hypothetical protein n=1 Tax=Streptomyces scopuliridis TaxID=452529 RepID=UPI0036CD6904